MTLEDLRELPGFRQNWGTVWPHLRSYLTDRVLNKARTGAEVARLNELATLIEDLATVATPVPLPQTAPTMKPLNSMLESSSE